MILSLIRKTERCSIAPSSRRQSLAATLVVENEDDKILDGLISNTKAVNLNDGAI